MIETLKEWSAQILKILGIVAGVGGSLAGLAYGVGYLSSYGAERLLGIPATTLIRDTHVHAGAIFFVNSLAEGARYIVGYEREPATTVLIFGLAILVALGMYSMSHSLKPTTDRRSVELICAVHLALLVILAIVIADILEPTHPLLRDLLLLTTEESNRLQKSSQVLEVANALFTDDQGLRSARVYGRYVVEVGVLIVFLGLWLQWLKNTNGSVSSDVNQSITQRIGLGLIQGVGCGPIALAVILALVVLPINYGVMHVSSRLSCATIYVPGKGEPQQDDIFGILIANLDQPDEIISHYDTSSDDFVALRELSRAEWSAMKQPPEFYRCRGFPFRK